MERQLHLLQPQTVRPGARRLDAKTRAAGRRGLAQARAALLAATCGPRPEPAAPLPPTSSNVRRPAA